MRMSQFRVLYRQFLLRIFDLEALSIQADIPRLLGQFASVLVFISLAVAFGLLLSSKSTSNAPEVFQSFSWSIEQGLVAATMLVVGLVTVVTWDATFPDGKDVMVLSPLPLPPRTILLAKISASAAILGLAILALNFASGLAWPFVLGTHHHAWWGFFQSLAAHWVAMLAAGVFVYGLVLTVQGFTALLLPRWLFLRVSSVLQIAAFIVFMGGYFLQPKITSPALATAYNHWAARSPAFWYFAVFSQLNGSLPSGLSWLAWRGWLALGAVAVGAGASLLLCYLRIMRKTLEQPDMMTRGHGWRWTPKFGNPIQTAIVLFSFRSLTRSRQHRLAFAFFMAVIFSIAMYWVQVELDSAGPTPLPPEFLIATFMMMGLAVVGLRSVFSLPISLTANWMLRTTQISPSEKYVAGSRRALLVLALLPVVVVSALLSLHFRPLHELAAHLVLLAVIGWIFVELSLIGFYKVPFTCSYLPGKTHIQIISGGVMLFVLALSAVKYELAALKNPVHYLAVVGVLIAAGFSLNRFNQRRAKSAVLYFEELPPEAVMTLGLSSIRRDELQRAG